MKKIIGLIPARGNSKGIKEKNLKLLRGKPLIAHTIETALKSKCFFEIYVSSEDSRILDIAKHYKVNIINRPSYLSLDNTAMIDVILHALSIKEHNIVNSDGVMLLQPTNPFRSAQTICNCINLFTKHLYDSLISVRKIPDEYNPHWAFCVDKNTHALQPVLFTNNIISRRQDLPNTYYRDGSIYLFKPKFILNHKTFYGKNLGYYISNEDFHINIDTMKDWILAKNHLKCVE